MPGLDEINSSETGVAGNDDVLNERTGCLFSILTFFSRKGETENQVAKHRNTKEKPRKTTVRISREQHKELTEIGRIYKVISPDFVVIKKNDDKCGIYCLNGEIKEVREVDGFDGEVDRYYENLFTIKTKNGYEIFSITENANGKPSVKHEGKSDKKPVSDRMNYDSKDEKKPRGYKFDGIDEIFYENKYGGEKTRIFVDVEPPKDWISCGKYDTNRVSVWESKEKYMLIDKFGNILIKIDRNCEFSFLFDDMVLIKKSENIEDKKSENIEDNKSENIEDNKSEKEDKKSENIEELYLLTKNGAIKCDEFEQIPGNTLEKPYVRFKVNNKRHKRTYNPEN